MCFLQDRRGAFLPVGFFYLMEYAFQQESVNERLINLIIKREDLK